MQTEQADLKPMDSTATTSCWKTIGVEGGDRSCDQLPALIHCRNCSIYAQGGRLLFDRPMPADYRRKLTALIAEAKTTKPPPSLSSEQQTLSLSLFRLQNEWFGLAAGVFDAVAAVAPIRQIPGRSNAVFLGLVNFNGELQLCISLKQVLGLCETTSTTQTPTAQTSATGLIPPRMVMVQPERDSNCRWVFTVDEFYGIQRIDSSQIQAPPASPGRASTQASFTQGLFEWQGKSVSYLDPESLFNSIERRLLL